jgi:hypothetical protein
MSEQAVASARAATARLTRQLLTLGETAAAIEARIAEERRLREEEDGEQMSRRVSLLVEALNSTAIDVTKLLSNEVTDSEWNAYLKGDRGIFTRRAVRLLDSGEAREVLRHYEEEPEFREQVNRYVHDFEAMLRRVLAPPDGPQLGRPLQCTHKGKQNLAMAQAIDPQVQREEARQALDRHDPDRAPHHLRPERHGHRQRHDRYRQRARHRPRPARQDDSQRR